VNVHCIIVCYRPDLIRLKKLCQTAFSDNSRIILLDNTEIPSISEEDFDFPVTLFSFGANTGLAYAQNFGLKSALTAGAKVITFFDQDSTIPEGFLKSIAAFLTPGLPGVVAPLCVDDMSGEIFPMLRLSRYGNPSKLQCVPSMPPCDVDIVISSGMTATSEVFEAAGGLDEDLFIDYVDTEWCLRCRKLGIPIRAIPSLIMYHRIGSRSIRQGPMSVLVHSPLRCYFQIRNGIVLFRKSHVPWFFTLRELLALFLSRALLLRFVDNPIRYIRAYAYGVRDGLWGVVGPPSAGLLRRLE
jgi:rhamnosyltransferase